MLTVSSVLKVYDYIEFSCKFHITVFFHING
jgi:transcriptional antiterminator Rof (Rho-off)